MHKFNTPSLLHYIIIFLAGALSILSTPPYSFLPFIFCLGFGIYSISFISSLRKTFIAAWSLGFGWFSFGLYWISSAFIVADTYHTYLMPFAIIILPSLLAILWGLAFVFGKLINKKNRFSIIYIIVFLSLFEYLRAYLFTGFPWLMPSIIFSSNEYFIQIFSFIGSFSTNLIVLIFSVLPFILLSNFKGKYFLFLILFTPIFLIFIFGFLRFHNKSLLKPTYQHITLVQPNIEQKYKWNLQRREQHLKNLIKLSSESFNNKNFTKRIIIWPETSFEGAIPSDKKLLSTISQKVIKNSNTILILGLLRTDGNSLYNSLAFLNYKGNIIHKYDKIRLVPFGEYIPFRKQLSFISNFLPVKDFSAGKNKPTIYIDGVGDVITLICYEILFSDLIKGKISSNTNLLINITNDAWFGETSGPYQHLALAKIKAVEFGLPLVRVANTGISVFISPYGEVLDKIPLNQRGVKNVKLVSALDHTLYKIFGEYIFIILIFVLIIVNKIYELTFKDINLYEK